MTWGFLLPILIYAAMFLLAGREAALLERGRLGAGVSFERAAMGIRLEACIGIAIFAVGYPIVSLALPYLPESGSPLIWLAAYVAFGLLVVWPVLGWLFDRLAPPSIRGAYGDLKRVRKMNAQRNPLGETR